MPDDVQRMAPFVLAPRLMLTSKAKYGGMDKFRIVSEALSSVKAPA